MQQAAASPKIVFAMTDIVATIRVSRIAASASGCINASPKKAVPFAKACAKIKTAGTSRNNPTNASANNVKPARVTGSGHRSVSSAMTTPRPILDAVDRDEDGERHCQHDGRDRRGARIVVLLQLGDDQQWHDFRHPRHVAGDEDHRTVLADGTRESESGAGSTPGNNVGKITRQKMVV